MIVNIEVVEKKKKYQNKNQKNVEVDIFYKDEEENPFVILGENGFTYSFDFEYFYPEHKNIKNLEDINVSDLDLFKKILECINFRHFYDIFYSEMNEKKGIIINGNYYDYEEIEHIYNLVINNKEKEEKN